MGDEEKRQVKQLSRKTKAHGVTAWQQKGST